MNSEKKKSAIVTGSNGQDGAYLCRLLLSKGYDVIGTYRRASTTNFWRIENLGIYDHSHLQLVDCDLTDPTSAIRMIKEFQPTEIYNLAAQSFVGSSFENPIATTQITGLGALNLLEAIRLLDPSIRFYQASTSEMFGKVQDVPQSEKTPFYPRSPYGTAKLLAHWTTINYRESYGIFGVSGILFNHESPLRGKEFVTRKITDAVSKIKLGKQDLIELGNLNAERDWGYAEEYVEGMWRMLQIDHPDTFVLASGKTTSVRHFVNLAFKAVGMDIRFVGQNESEIGIDESNGKTVVRVNPKFYRPAEVDRLLGDPSKAQRKLDWKVSTCIESLCSMMVHADLERNQRQT